MNTTYAMRRRALARWGGARPLAGRPRRGESAADARARRAREGREAASVADARAYRATLEAIVRHGDVAVIELARDPFSAENLARARAVVRELVRDGLVVACRGRTPRERDGSAIGGDTCWLYNATEAGRRLVLE